VVGKKMMLCKIPSTFISFGYGIMTTVIVLSRMLFFQLLSQPNVSSEKLTAVEKNKQIQTATRQIKNNPQQLWRRVSKLTSISSSESNPIDIALWKINFSSLFSYDPPQV